MKKIIFLASCALLMSSYAYSEDESTAMKLVNSIHSVEQVKRSIRELLLSEKELVSGGAVDQMGEKVCELVGALDIKVDSQITNTYIQSTKSKPNPEIEISKSDLNLMRLIFAQCKPNNYHFWLRDSVLHVSYTPTEDVDRTVKNALNIK